MLFTSIDYTLTGLMQEQHEIYISHSASATLGACEELLLSNF